jgi:hypothetical protein
MRAGTRCVPDGRGLDLGVGVGDGLPVQVTPLSAKSAGAGLLALFHEPLKPIVA